MRTEVRRSLAFRLGDKPALPSPQSSWTGDILYDMEDLQMLHAK